MPSGRGPVPIDLDAVTDLLRTALGARDVEVDVQDGELTATIETGGTVLSPGQAHAAAMAALPGHDTAMAPHRYVLGDGSGSGRE
ncbi:hypothetical protein [Kitasatospora sp. NPDC059673]|uniref:hypothetical protein n=1 Tax=Kitasatospora sp. NPDC059673 TaxID=3346901 RepID=UPI003678B5DE